MMWLARKWLCTQIRSAWPGGGTDRGRWGWPSFFALPSACIAGTDAASDASAGVGAVAASVLAYRTPIVVVVRAPLLKRRRLLSSGSGSGRRVFIVVGARLGCLSLGEAARYSTGCWRRGSRWWLGGSTRRRTGDGNVEMP